MSSEKKTAIILGATGLTGSLLLEMLLTDDRYEKIKVFTRRPLEVSDPKLEAIQCSLLELNAVKDDFIGDEVFCCIGTTTKKTPDKKLYHKIDYGIPVSAAMLCKENNIPTLVIVSAIGANADSSIFYNKTKGEMERDVLAQNIQHTYILQPSIINGPRNESRAGEKIGVVITRFLQPLLMGSLKKYRVINGEVISKAMVKLANNGFDHQVIASDQIQELGR
jgi:uncharacterized protein YbjT (DUF2867 family)